VVTLAVGSVLLMSCAETGLEASRTGASDGDAVSAFASLQGPYLGLEPPGQEARLFAPGLLSTGMNDRDIAVSPHLDEIVFGVLEAPHSALFVATLRDDGSWSPPRLLPFCGRYDDVEPHFSPDGSRLYFCSNRPLEHGGEQKDYDIWFVERTPAGWGEPQNPGPPLSSDEDEFYPSVTRDGSVFFTAADMTLQVCANGPDGLEPRRPLPDTVNSGRAEYNAFVDPDQRYIIFTSHGWGGGVGRGDLFVSFHRDGRWSAAVNLGPGVNSEGVEMSPSVSPDGRYLFFSSMRKPEDTETLVVTCYEDMLEHSRGPQNGKMDLYWVDASVLEGLAPS
jgi:Tol biopolymer transport system component